MFQTLENRVLFALTYISDGVLRIVGTDVIDTVEFALNGKDVQVVVDGTEALTFNVDTVRQISYHGRGGNDVLVIGRVPIRAYIDGGEGNDALSASHAPMVDSIIGGAGNDYLWGGGGNDYLAGNDGGDAIMGGDGDDTLFIRSDGTDDDSVSGGAGYDTVDAVHYPMGVTLAMGDATASPLTVFDTIYNDVECLRGTAYDDNISVISGRPVTVFLGKGRDIFTGGSGADTVYGQASQDEIFGAGGDDVFYLQDNTTDGVIGGSGEDTAYADSFDILDTVENVITP